MPTGAGLLADARAVMGAGGTRSGLWCRCTALLTRQALETALAHFWGRRHQFLMWDATFTSQLLCLPSFLPHHPELATQVGQTWAALSNACHYHAYELPPTESELEGWIQVVQRFVHLASD